MRIRSTYFTLFVLTSGLAAHVGCGGDDSSGGSPDATDGGSDTTLADGAPGPGPGDDDGPGPGPGDDAGSEAGADAGPTVGPRILGYVFSNSPAADESTPSASFSYNSSGGAMKITRTDAGRYNVTFTGLDLTSTVALASAYDTQGGLCHWGTTTGESVSVRCLNAAGNSTDAKFVLTVFGEGTKGASVLGFAHANEKATASYTPDASRSNNTGGGAITASRTAPGTYKMDFGGIALDDVENVQVMPYGDPAARCAVKSWGGSTVNVYCYDAAGTLADSEYTVLLAGKKPGGTARVVAYAHADDSATASYVPSLSYNEGGGGVTATRSAAGTYAIAFDGRDLTSGAHVQVSS